MSEPDEFRSEALDSLRSRGIVLFNVFSDAVLVVGMGFGALGVNYLIGDISAYPLIDRVVLIAAQVILAIGTIGTMLAYLIVDMRRAVRRAREKR